MNPRLMDRLRAVAGRCKEVESLLVNPEIAPDRVKMKRLAREYKVSQAVVQLWNKYQKTESDLASARAILKEETDAELVELAHMEIADAVAEMESLEGRIKRVLVPPGDADHADAVMEIRAGTGGEEASLFAAELYRMYLRFAERKDWKASEISSNDTGLGGIKEVVFEMSGDNAYRLLKLESGVHRVQRVPATESQGRLHTSAATVAVLPKAEEVDVKIDDSEVRTDVFHASGAGGQNVNKVATAIRLLHLPTGIVVTCQNERSQLQNRLKAMEVLRSRLWAAELRNQKERISADRRSQVGGGDRSEKIRTYNFPQNRVTDHRVNVTSHNLQRILDGDLYPFVEALQADEQARRLAEVE